MSTKTETETEQSNPVFTSKPAQEQVIAAATQTNTNAADNPKEIVADSKTPWSAYMNSLNSKYQDRIRKAAQSPNYILTMRYEDGREVKQTFSRMKLLQYQFEEIEDLRAEANELSVADKARESTKKLAEMYSRAASYILWNVKEERPMTADEYRHCLFSEVRPALDASMLLGLISDPN